MLTEIYIKKSPLDFLIPYWNERKFLNLVFLCENCICHSRWYEIFLNSPYTDEKICPHCKEVIYFDWEAGLVPYRKEDIDSDVKYTGISEEAKKGKVMMSTLARISADSTVDYKGIESQKLSYIGALKYLKTVDLLNKKRNINNLVNNFLSNKSGTIGMKTYHYPCIKFDIGPVAEKKSKIIIPDFDIEIEFVDGGPYSSYTILKKIAEYKLHDTISCYLKDGRTLPKVSEEEDLEELLQKYNESVSWLHVEVQK